MISKIQFCILFVGLIASSCNKDEPAETVQECKFVGSTRVIESKNNSSKYTETTQRNFELRGDNFPLKSIISTESFDRDTVQTKISIQTASTQESNFTYDSEGFLIKKVEHSVESREAGELYNILYEGSSQPVKQLTTESHVETEFKYQDGLLKETNYTQNTTYKSAPKPDFVKNSAQNRVYAYDPQKKLTSVTVTESNGARSVFKYENGLIVSLTNGSGQLVTTYEYVNGKQSRIIFGGGSELRFQYDARGNMTQHETVSNNTVFSRTEFTYDSNRNPEFLIPVNFKGVPISIHSIHTNENTNNLTSEKITQFTAGSPRVISDYKTTYTYDANGLPLSSKAIISGGQTGTINTTYRYENCD